MSFESDSTDDPQEPKQEQHSRPRSKRIVLPFVIPWESAGSSKFASQKGTGGFQRIRDCVPNIQCSTGIVETHAVPFHMCPPLKKSLASQAGSTPFGGHRDQLTYVRENNEENKKKIHELVVDFKATERVNPRLNASNPEATNEQIGRPRATIAKSTGGRRFTPAEQLKCRGELPRFQCMRETAAGRDAEANGSPLLVGGLHSNRKTITPVVGLNRTKQDELDSNRYMAWLGGQLTLQSQAHSGGFFRQRDPANRTFYDKLAEQPAEKTAEEREADRQRRLAALDEKADVENSFAVSNVAETVRLASADEPEDVEDEEYEEEEENDEELEEKEDA